MEFRPFWEVLAELGIDLPDPARIQMPEAGTSKRPQSPDCWIPPGETIDVAGYEIPGMVYCGESLMAVNRPQNFEPSLIHSGLRVDARKPDYAGKALTLYSSYYQMTPANRMAYLEWLASGRRMTGIGSSYVILFFHGLERRVFHDLVKLSAEKYPSKPNELKQIAEEARQLKQRYRSSFGTNIDRLIEACELQLSEFEWIEISPTTTSAVYFQVGLGQFVDQGQPIPADWALAYCQQFTKWQNATAVKRYPDEFRELFKANYQQCFGDGIVIESNQTRLRFTFRPSSSSFANQMVTIAAKKLPTIESLAGALSQLGTVLEDCRKDLDPFVRVLGRNPELRNSPTAIAPLPKALWHLSPNLTKLENSLQQRFQKTHIILMPGETLLKDWQSANSDKLTQTELKSLAAFLEQCGYRVEPDLKSITNKSFLALYHAQPGEITQRYEIASLAVYFSVAILMQENAAISAKRNCEATAPIKSEIDAFFSLSAAEKIRLEAYFAWLLTQSPSLRNLKSRIEKIDPEDRKAIAKFLIQTTAKGSVSPKTVQQLEKAYTLLGLDEKAVYSDIHDRSTSDDPVTVLKASPVEGFAIPKEEPLTLNMSLIQSKIAESHEISGLLAEIFVDEQEAPKPVTIAGLDAAHSELLSAIAAKEIWEREELIAIATHLNLMLDGALEVINEIAFDLCDEPVIDGDNTLEVNASVLQEILG